MTSKRSGHKEQRYRRVQVSVGIRISTIDPETDPATGRPYFRTSEETCANVSRGGAYVETTEAISPGRRLLLEIELPGGASLDVPAETLARPVARDELVRALEVAVETLRTAHESDE